MMDDYLFDGLGPSPEALQAWDESRAAREAAEQKRAPPTLEEQLEHEKARAAALEDELKAARGETEAWVRACVEIKILRRVLNHRVVLHAIEHPTHWLISTQVRATAALANALLLNPGQNAGYAATAKSVLRSALSSIGFVTGLRYCDCSFPASDASKPEIVLRRWSSLDDSEWDVSWTPIWTAEACVDGSRGISFTTLLKVTNIALRGRIRLTFAADGSQLKVSFLETPAFRCDVACHVTLGQVPLPIQAELGRVVRDEATRWLDRTMVAPNAYRIVLSKRKPLSDDDLARAMEAAKIGAERAVLGSRFPSSPLPDKRGPGTL